MDNKLTNTCSTWQRAEGKLEKAESSPEFQRRIQRLPAVNSFCKNLCLRCLTKLQKHISQNFCIKIRKRQWGMYFNY